VRRALALALGLVAGAATAAAAESVIDRTIDPGLWEVTSTIESGDMPGAQMDVGKVMDRAPTVARHCLTPEDAAKGPEALLLLTRPDCSFLHSSMAHGRLHATLSCGAGTPDAMTVEVNGRFSSKRYKAISDIAMARDHMAMTISATAKWIGACSS
jgi:hypothetical protein